jgi:hypothetical protein
MNRNNYFLDRNSKTGEIIYLEYDKVDGYNITPKTKVEDAIEVNKIVFVNPSLSEKLIKKKIDIKIRYLLRKLEEIDENGGDDEDGIRKSLMDAERLKLMILNNYVKYLGHTYQSLTVKKIQIITNQLRVKLYDCIDRKRRIVNMDNLYYLDSDEYKTNRGRGR